MKKKTAICIILLFFLFAGGAYADNPGKVISFKGYQKIEIGKSIQTISRATGFKFKKDSEAKEDFACTYAVTPSLPGMYIMLVKDVVARIDVDKGDYTTPEGARLGDSEKNIKKLYPKAEIEGQKYVPEGHYITVRSSDKRHAILLETDGKKVTAFRVGRMPEIEWVEGCN
ncbi:MAG: hypothetical protein K4571_18580 [Deltaproteobacteria bacterium]